MNVLVVGGAGYIGSHAVQSLEAAGHTVWVYDNLSFGHRGAVTTEQLIVGDLLEGEKLLQVFTEKKIDSVMHFAAFAMVGESVLKPAKYYQNNVVGTLTLLESMRATGVQRIVFSSTCATYGTPKKIPITETTPQLPINPYGFTKLTIEQALQAYAEAYGFGFAALRYFNAAGASTKISIGEDHLPESHLIPLVLKVALGQRDSITLFGSDYPTPDGTCIRDYIHVEDLGTAHVKALEKLTEGSQLKINLGTGLGVSVQEVVDAARRVTGHPIPIVLGSRRPGDPAELVADNRLALKVLDWTPKYNSIEETIATAWTWHQANPRGYDDRGESGILKND